MNFKFFQILIVLFVFAAPVQASENGFDLTRTNTYGEFGGLGIEVAMKGGVVKIYKVIEGAPAKDAGLRVGDIITHVEGESVKSKSLKKVLEEIRGEPGTQVKITGLRSDNDEPVDFSVTREILKKPSASIDQSDDYLQFVLFFIAAAIAFLLYKRQGIKKDSESE